MGTYLGQNFLIDAKVRQYIADHIFSLYRELGCEALIEIGPGKGSITRLINTVSSNFFLIEKDEKLVGTRDAERVTGNVIVGDVLDLNVKTILETKKLDTKKTLVVGNLPYYITSPILRKFFGNGSQEFAGGIFMVQDEVAQRLDSQTHKKSYLRWLLHYAYQVKYLKGVPAKCFKPAPKVKSALIALNVKRETVNVKFEKLIQFLDLYSPFTRKTLGAIGTMLTKKVSRDPEVSRAGAGCGTSFVIPEYLRKKRMEELTWEELEEILK